MHHYTALDQIHILLALSIMFSYLSIPLTALRHFPMPPVATWASRFFFATCAVTHLAIAAHFHDSPWMVLNDLIQAVSAVLFIVSLSRMVAAVLERQAAKRAEKAEG